MALLLKYIGTELLITGATLGFDFIISPLSPILLLPRFIVLLPSDAQNYILRGYFSRYVKNDESYCTLKLNCEFKL
jgi:hypothetical protein